MNLTVHHHISSVIIVANTKWSGQVIAEFDDQLFGSFKGFGNGVNRLHGGDWETQVSHLVTVQRNDLRDLGHGMLHFINTAQHTSAISLAFAIIRNEAELNGEPIESTQAFNISVSGSEGGQSDFLRKIRDLRIPC